ncbi:hypothetical protein FB451DRAFT_1394603 [Mycena latifolia]|nr:hypothetical protein FB451DRAFT_1394603 [Mycena latifolia]
MCHDAVPCRTFSCGHSKPDGERTQVDCGSRRCRYSKNHPAPCTNCVNTCQQWMMQPRLYSAGAAPDLCFNCLNPPRRG